MKLENQKAEEPTLETTRVMGKAAQESVDAGYKVGASTKDAVKQVSHAAQETLDAAKNSFVQAIDHNRALAQKMAQAMRDVSLQFMNARLEHTGRAIERSRECRGISEMIVLQQDWLIDATRDYAEVTRRFAEVLQDVPQNGAAHDLDEPAHSASRRREGGGDRVAA